jgi:hypothetical protein
MVCVSAKTTTLLVVSISTFHQNHGQTAAIPKEGLTKAPAMSSPVLFVIVGKNEPLFEAEIDTSHSSGGRGGGSPGGGGGGRGGGGQQQSELSTRQNYFVLHSALDLVEKSAWTTNSMYLRVVDKVNQQQVSTFLTAANVKFMLLHGGKGEEVIKNFFNEVYGYYVKVCMCLNAREDHYGE